MILHINETIIRVRKKHCDVSNICSMFFTRNIVFFDDSQVLKYFVIVFSQTE